MLQLVEWDCWFCLSDGSAVIPDKTRTNTCVRTGRMNPFEIASECRLQKDPDFQFETDMTKQQRQPEHVKQVEISCNHRHGPAALQHPDRLADGCPMNLLEKVGNFISKRGDYIQEQISGKRVFLAHITNATDEAERLEPKSSKIYT